MNNLIDELMNDFESLSITEKTKVDKFVSIINNVNNDCDDINDLVSNFSQLELSSKPNVINAFYTFLFKCINRDRRYVNSTLFSPPEPPYCN
jgi:hypothetical protein